jgi:hypothetical protein
MLYDRFESNANLDLHSKQMMHEKTVPWDGPGYLSAHADMDDFLDIPMSFLFVVPSDRRFESISAGCCPCRIHGHFQSFGY